MIPNCSWAVWNGGSSAATISSASTEGCQKKATTVDHVVPLCQGGSTTWQNLVGCCLTCNQAKGGRTPEQAGMVLKRQPKGPRAHLFEQFEQLLKRASAA